MDGVHAPPIISIGRGRGQGRGRGTSIKKTLNTVPNPPKVKPPTNIEKRFVTSNLFRKSISSIEKQDNNKTTKQSEVIEVKDMNDEVIEVTETVIENPHLKGGKKPTKVREWDKGKVFEPKSGQWFKKKGQQIYEKNNNKTWFKNRFEDAYKEPESIGKRDRELGLIGVC